jgi:hypothetical protein
VQQFSETNDTRIFGHWQLLYKHHHDIQIIQGFPGPDAIIQDIFQSSHYLLSMQTFSSP